MYKLRSKRQPQPTSSTAAVATAKALPAPALATTADDDNDYDDDDNNDASTSKDMQIGNRGVVKANSHPEAKSCAGLPDDLTRSGTHWRNRCQWVCHSVHAPKTELSQNQYRARRCGR